MVSLILTTLIVFHEEYQCRLSWYEDGKCGDQKYLEELGFLQYC